MITKINLKDLNKKKLFCFDVFGVLHAGKELFPEIKEILIEYKKKGKVAIITNATGIASEIEENLLKKDIIKNIHYDAVFTSGDVLIDFVKNQKEIGSPITLYKEQKDTQLYQEISKYCDIKENIEEAEYIYISLYKNENEKNKYNLKDKLTKYEAKDLFELINKMKNEIQKEDFSFEDFCFSKIKLNDLKNKKFLCPNCDIIAMNGEELILVQGFFAFLFQDKNNNIKFFGKPFQEIFQKALNYFSINAEDAIMFGDQYSTDLTGANNCEIDTVLINSSVTDLTKGFIYSEKIKPLIKVSYKSESIVKFFQDYFLKK